jgi:hypothetical protein
MDECDVPLRYERSETARHVVFQARVGSSREQQRLQKTNPLGFFFCLFWSPFFWFPFPFPPFLVQQEIV